MARSLKAETAGLLSERHETIDLYDSLLLSGKPDLSRYGLKRSRTVYENELWPPKRSVIPDEAAVRSKARAVLAEGVTAAVPVILDVEQYSVDVRLDISHINPDTSAVDSNILKLEQIIGFKNEAPALQVGFFDVAAPVDGLPVTGQQPANDAELAIWKRANSYLIPFVAHVGALYRSLYMVDTEQLAAELGEIKSTDKAANWAHRVLGAKNTLSAADAASVEEAFRAKLAILRADSTDGSEMPRETQCPPSQRGANRGKKGQRSTEIDKSALTLSEPRRVRDREHVRYVTRQSCLICGRRPSDAHHLRFAQSRALNRKVSDEFTVPLCRGHHREVHRSGDEAAWWAKAGVDPTATARRLWLETHPLPAIPDKALAFQAAGRAQDRSA